MSVEIKNLVKIYGEQKAVDNISFTAKKGEILGFLGPNGAGKSTTMKITTGYLPQTSGSISVCGFDVDVNNKETKRLIGYLPENNPLYIDMYVREYLEFCGKSFGMKSDFLSTRINETIELTGLTLERKKKTGQLSKGYKQRVGLAAAMLHNPEILILDEPTTGLDPNQVVEIRNLIKQLGKEKTVIFSTHIMQEVQQVCDRVVIINSGKIVANDIISNIASSMETKKGFRISVEFETETAISVLQNIDGIEKVEAISSSKFILYSTQKDIRSAIFKAISAQNLNLIELKMEEYSLEEVFQSLTTKNI